jgi:hypothetical protein
MSKRVALTENIAPIDQGLEPDRDGMPHVA